MRRSSGRYVVRLPFRSPGPSLGSSYSAALRMLTKQQRCLASDDVLSRLYSEFLREYAELRHMSPVSSSRSEETSAHFLPHHGVLREGSSTTKLRVVFNGSFRTSTGVSLNDCLHVGPKQQLDIFDVLLRWRRYPYVFSADVEKMYRQIEVHHEDRRFQHILWSESGQPTEYQLNTVTYGLACAPYLALRVLCQLDLDEGSRFPNASDVILKEMYVDDVLSGADTITLVRVKAHQVDKLLMAGGFTLQKWTSNEPAVIADIDDCRHADASPRQFYSESFARALGMAWIPSSDVFVMQPRFSPSPSIITKRVVLSRVAQLFDPLGLITPITIAAKIFIQELWKLHLDWDDPLPESCSQRWHELAELLGTTSITIQRWIGFSSSSLAVELHGFSDASQHALGAVIYVRVLDDLDNARISLVAAKSKVAPLKRITIPRLELSAAVLMARLLTQVQRIFQFDIASVHLWVDSTVALTWIHGQPARWKDFVANRVALIHEIAPSARWHHVAGEENPADCASRGLTPQKLSDHRLWWKGPAWLSQPSTMWPSATPHIDSAQDLEERTPHVTVAVSHQLVSWDLVDRYSKLSRLIRITGSVPFGHVNIDHRPD